MGRYIRLIASEGDLIQKAACLSDDAKALVRVSLLTGVKHGSRGHSHAWLFAILDDARGDI